MQIKDIAKVQGGYAFKSEQFISNAVPIIRIGNINGLTVDIDNDICYPQDFWNENLVYRINKNDILIAMSGATVGKVGKYCFDKGALLNQRVCKLIPKSNIYNDFLYYYCLSPVFKKEIQENAFGCAQPNISVKQIETFYINVPNLLKQEKAIKKFKYISKIIDLYNQQLEQLDLLIKSRFVEMFGDVISNEKKWNMSIWNDVLTIKNGRNQKAVENINGKYAICGSGGIMGYATDYITEANSVIIGRKGNINKPILMRERFWNVDTAFGLEPNQSINVEYLYMFCLLFDFGRLNKAVTIPSLTKADLLNIKMPIPPIELQKEFAQFVEQVEKSKTQVQKSLDEAQLLFDSLMQEYFG